MKKIVLTFGTISGCILVVLSGIWLFYLSSRNFHMEGGELVGYSTMFLAYIVVFFGIRQYREEVGGGAITFGRAFKVGILMVLIVSAMYVALWEIVYYNFMPDFAEKYAATQIEKMRTEGASATAIAARQQEMARFAELYKNPLVNIGMTLLEVFPLGLIMTLVSAAILRRKAFAPPSGEKVAHSAG
jgi:hypothetical protein